MKKIIRNGRAGLLALASSLLLTACNQADTPQAAASDGEQAPPRAIEVMTLSRQDIPLNKSYPAKLQSENEVTLVARVTGFLQARLFEPGDLVEKGDSLYTIEPDLYQAQTKQREADLASAQAELARAQRDASRFQQLLSQNSVSRQQVDQAQAELNVARASVAQAEAALASANIDLGYANVTAPVAGRISLSRVNVGNLLTPGTELATITPLDPLEVRFQLPQEDAFALRQQLDDQPVNSIRAQLAVPSLQSVSEQPEGHLDFLGSRVDEGTSTVQAQAVFANPEARVLPGQFVRVRLQGMQRFDVLAVPELALTQGLMGPQVYVLDEDNVARARTVQLGELAGPWQILLDGVESGERVVVGDPAGIQPGTRIDPQPFDGDARALLAQDGSARNDAGASSAEMAQEDDGS